MAPINGNASGSYGIAAIRAKRELGYEFQRKAYAIDRSEYLGWNPKIRLV